MDKDRPDADAAATPPGGRSMPKTAPFKPTPANEPGPAPDLSVASSLPPAAAAPPLAAEPVDRTGVFGRLVTDDSDIAGLVAYSIYKQHKLDWLTAFEKAKGRPPNDAELASYIIGEGTARRLATYRHLAEATLEGNGPQVAGAGKRNGTPRRSLSDRSALTTGLLATYALIAVLFLVGFLLAAHYTMSAR